MQDIVVDTGRAITPEQLASVFARSGINRPTHDMARMRKMVDGADLMITAWDGELLVGVARSLTDFCAACYLADLAVDRAYQQRGIGAQLVGQVRQTIGADAILLLLAAPSALGYYPRIGFASVDNGFIIRPQPQETVQ